MIDILKLVLQISKIRPAKSENSGSSIFDMLKFMLQVGKSESVDVAEEKEDIPAKTPCKPDWNELSKAVDSGDVAKVSNLIKLGVDVNNTDSMGRTVLHYAAAEGNIAIMRALFCAGIDESIEGQAGYTARRLAKENGRENEYNAALFEANKMKSGEGYYGWLAEQARGEKDS